MLKLGDYRNKLDATIGLSIAYYYKDDKKNAEKYLQQAKLMKPALTQGMAGIAELEEEGYLFSEKNKETLKKMLEEFNR
jgi:hypothetical protein